jgi:hypothetical protein
MPRRIPALRPLLAAAAAAALALSLVGANCNQGEPKVYAPTRDLVPDGASLTLKLGAPRDLTLDAELRGVAPQFFHPQTKDAFLAGAAFYDPVDPGQRHTLPQGMYRFWRSFGQTFVGYGSDGLRVARNDETTSHPVAAQTPNLGAAEGALARNGDLWLALTDRPYAPTTMGLLRVRGTSGQLFPNPVGNRARIPAGDIAVATLDDDRTVLAWVEPNANGLSVLLSFYDAPSSAFTTPVQADSVTLDPAATELAGRSGTELTLVGLVDKVAVAWRLIVPDGPIDPGSAAAPPSRPIRAEVRLALADGRSAPHVMRHGTWATPPGGTSGVGPWPLVRSGLAGARVSDVAVFAWNDVSGNGARVLAVAARDGDAPKVVTDLVWRLQFRKTQAGTDLLLYAPNGAARAASVEYTY